jgi:hypothetical protein
MLYTNITYMFREVSNFIIKLFEGNSNDAELEQHINIEIENTKSIDSNEKPNGPSCYTECKIENRVVKKEEENPEEKEEEEPEEEEPEEKEEEKPEEKPDEKEEKGGNMIKHIVSFENFFLTFF